LKRIGFIGLGLMGEVLAGRLMAAGSSAIEANVKLLAD